MSDVIANPPYPNPAFVKPGNHTFNTQLPLPDELRFNTWLKENNVPFNPRESVTDYDMRGFWSALQQGNPIAQSSVNPNDQQMHYPDYWKTPYHPSFSSDSQWASPTAPTWNDKDQLVGPDGAVLYDERARSR